MEEKDDDDSEEDEEGRILSSSDDDEDGIVGIVDLVVRGKRRLKWQPLGCHTRRRKTCGRASRASGVHCLERGYRRPLAVVILFEPKRK